MLSESHATLIIEETRLILTQAKPSWWHRKNADANTWDLKPYALQWETFYDATPTELQCLN